MKLMYKPLITIVIPVYNGKKYVGQAIESALNQTYKNIEIILVDDGSTDGSEEVYNKYAEIIKIFKKENGGVSTALNMAIDNMSGEYFSWLSHDDLYSKDKILNQVKILQDSKNREKIIFGSNSFISSRGFYLKKNEIKNIIESKFLNDKWVMLLLSQISGCTLLIPGKFLVINKFNINLPNTQDYDLWLRFAKKYDFIYDNSNCVKVRIHKESGSSNLSKEFKKEESELWMNILNSFEKTTTSKKFLGGWIYIYCLRYKLSDSDVYKEYIKDKILDEKNYQKNLFMIFKKRNFFIRIIELMLNIWLAIHRWGFKDTFKKMLEVIKAYKKN